MACSSGLASTMASLWMRSSRAGSRLGLFMNLLPGCGGPRDDRFADGERFRICRCGSVAAPGFPQRVEGRWPAGGDVSHPPGREQTRREFAHPESPVEMLGIRPAAPPLLDP